MKIVFLARELGFGGAERQLALLAKGLAAQGHAVIVLSFYAGGPFYEEITKAGVTVVSLGKRGRWDVLRFAVRFLRTVRAQRPDILHSYLMVPNVLAVLLKPLIKKTRIVWGVRASNVQWRRYGALLVGLEYLERRLSGFADLIIVNSLAGYGHALAAGFPRKKMTVIPNGIDVDEFRIDRAAGIDWRRQWGIDDGRCLIGLVGRLDPMKDPISFLEAAGQMARTRGDVRFVCVGSGTNAYARRLAAIARDHGLDERMTWVDSRVDMRPIYSALDILTSTSVWGEGFSNVVAEAMACGVPCVVTDVGDSASIVGDCGVVVPAGDAAAVFEGWRRLIERRQRDGIALQHAVRARIVDNFSARKMIDRTTEVLAAAVARRV